MTLLILFALIAGAGTALSPCVLPILPAVLSAGVTGGRRRPAGVVTGIVVAFTFATVALVYVIDALGLPDDFVRWVAIGTLFVFGIVLLVPPLADRVEAFISRIVPGPCPLEGRGVLAGLPPGNEPGPGLRAVRRADPGRRHHRVSASQDFTAGKLAVAFAYAIGSGAVLYALMLGGRKLIDRMGSWRHRVQAVMGALMVLTAVAMAAELDIRFQTTIADDLPGFPRQPDRRHRGLGCGRRRSRRRARAEETAHRRLRLIKEVEPEVVLPELGLAPEFTGTQQWFNTDGEPISIASEVEQGHVVLIDFWTYTCINCIRTLPYLKAWDEEYRDDGLTIVGVHAPEFPFEKEASNVEDAIADNGIEYPVVQDNELATWTAWGNQYWPAKYLIDADGQVRYTHFGEGSYDETEQAIRSLLAEAGDDDLGAEAKAKARANRPGPR